MINETLARSTREAEYIYNVAPMCGYRTGQLLFNSLRYEVAEKIRGTIFDPFYKEMSLFELIEWINNHIIYDNEGMMICVFDGNTILWEESKNG